MTSSIAMPSSERVPYFDMLVRVVLAVYIAVLPFKSLLIVERNGFILLLGLLVGWSALNRRLVLFPDSVQYGPAWPLSYGSGSRSHFPWLHLIV